MAQMCTVPGWFILIQGLSTAYDIMDVLSIGLSNLLIVSCVGFRQQTLSCTNKVSCIWGKLGEEPAEVEQVVSCTWPTWPTGHKNY